MPDTLFMGNATQTLDLTEEATFEGYVHVAHSFCSCQQCDTARRVCVAAFAASWIAQHSVSELEGNESEHEVSGVQTVRPPAMGSGSYSVSRGVAA